MERLVTAQVVAKHTDEKVRTVYRKARDGEYPCYRSGRLVRFKLSEIDEAMKGGKDAKNEGTRRRSNLAVQS